MIQACYQPLQPHYQVQQVFHRTPRNSVFLSSISATLASLWHDIQCPRLYTGTYYGTDSQVDKDCAGHPFKRLHTDSETKNIYQIYCMTCCWETKYGQFNTA